MKECKWCKQPEDKCTCDPATKALNVQIEALTAQATEMTAKLADGVSGEDMKTIRETVEKLETDLGVLLKEKEAVETKAANAALAAQVKALSDTITQLGEIKTAPKIEFPTNNQRSGNLDAKTNAWRHILLGNLQMKEGKLVVGRNGEASTKALATVTAGSGQEWVVNGVIDDFFDLIRLENQLLSKMRDYPLSSGTDIIPIQTGDMTWYLMDEADDDDESTTVTASTPGTGKVSVTAKKFMGRTWVSSEETEDSIVPLIPQLQRNIVVTAGNTIENVLLNGDSNTTHMDNDITASSDRRKAWKGLRRLGIDASMTTSLATFSSSTVLSVKTKLGASGVSIGNLLWVLAPTTNDKLIAACFGDAGQGFREFVTITSGQITALFGIPAITSGQVREDLAASGVYDGTTTNTTSLTLFRTDRFANGNRRNLTIKSEEKIEADQLQVVASFRRGMSPVRTPNNTTEKSVSLGIAVPIT